MLVIVTIPIRKNDSISNSLSGKRKSTYSGNLPFREFTFFLTWDDSLNMFVGEFAVWSVYLYQRYQKRQSSTIAPPSAVNQLDAATVVDDVDQSIMNKVNDDLPELSGWKAFLFWIPTLCDLTATTVNIPISIIVKDRLSKKKKIPLRSW